VNRKREAAMILSNRLRQLRREKKLSQGDIERRSGLVRCYISRIENGHTVPVIDTLEKLARALEVPLYKLFYDGEEPPKLPYHLKKKHWNDKARASSRKNEIYLHTLVKFLRKASDTDRELLLLVAQKIATVRNRRATKAA
jgi:transcriptional regulator with XRE-family HTH domain